MIAIITAVAITLTLLLAAAGYLVFRGGQTKSQRRSDRIVITAPQVELCMTPHPKPPSVQTPGSPTPKDFTLWLPPSPKANYYTLKPYYAEWTRLHALGKTLVGEALSPAPRRQ